MRKLFARLMLPVAVLLNGCAQTPAPPLEITDPTHGMIFGSIQADVMITRVVLHEYGKFYLPPFVVPPKVQVYPNGDFVAVNLKPGKYYLAGFTARKGLSEFHNFRLSAKNISPYMTVITVKPGALQYVGSFRISGRLQFDKNAKAYDFYITHTYYPGEREILRRIYDLTDGTGWQDRINQRLKYLSM